MFRVRRVQPVDIRVCSGIVRFRWVVVCSGGGWKRFLVFEGGNDVGLGLVIANACFMYFSVRFGRVDEPELCALA